MDVRSLNFKDESFDVAIDKGIARDCGDLPLHVDATIVT